MNGYASEYVSSDIQTVENQRFEINNFCERENLKIDGWIEETISGTKSYSKRELGKLLKQIQKDDHLYHTQNCLPLIFQVKVAWGLHHILFLVVYQIGTRFRLYQISLFFSQKDLRNRYNVLLLTPVFCAI